MKTYEEGFIAGFSHNIKTVEELEERIKKAIEILLDNTLDYTDGDFESMKFQNDIVEILKGNEK